MTDRADARPITTVLFAGGGTGGHLYPALAIAEACAARAEAQRRPTPTTRFLCSQRAVDRTVLSAAQVDCAPVPAQPFGVRPRALVRFLRAWSPSVRAGRDAIRRARESGPVFMVATGGFVSAPLAQAARADRVDLTLVNLDAVPGKANRWVARFADRVFTALPVAPEHRVAAAQWTLIPPIVRASARLTIAPSEARRQLGLDPDRPTLLVTGASLGAKSINDFLAAFAIRDSLRNWQVLHQTGPQADPGLAELYRQAGIPARVEPFVTQMGLWWRAADLAVSRAGAGLVAEAWANQVPTLFLPYPYHHDQHQRLNAKILVDAGGAALEQDRVHPEANLRLIGGSLEALLNSPDRRAQMRSALAGLGPVDGAERVAAALGI